jgi:hypothetical protein
MIEAYEAKMKARNRKVNRNEFKEGDERLSPSYRRLFSQGGGTINSRASTAGSNRPVNSIPMAGQMLITSKLKNFLGTSSEEELSSLEERPKTVWAQQAEKSIKESEVWDVIRQM